MSQRRDCVLCSFHNLILKRHITLPETAVNRGFQTNQCSFLILSVFFYFMVALYMFRFKINQFNFATWFCTGKKCKKVDPIHRCSIWSSIGGKVYITYYELPSTTLRFGDGNYICYGQRILFSFHSNCSVSVSVRKWPAVIGTHSFNSPQSITSFLELPALGSSHFTKILPISQLPRLTSMYNTLPIAPLINLSEISRLLVCVILSLTPIFKTVERLAVLLSETV